MKKCLGGLKIKGEEGCEMGRETSFEIAHCKLFFAFLGCAALAFGKCYFKRA
jgi:hypothetical protein